MSDLETREETQRIRPRRRARRCLAIGLLGIAFFGFFGCTSVITPPRDPQEPVSVIVLAEVMHRGLLFPLDVDGEPDRGYVEFGFGDWEWFARGNDAWYRVFPTVLWPTRATLARREHRGRSVLELKEHMPSARFQELKVARAGMQTLRDRLQGTFDAGADQMVSLPGWSMRFVPDDTRGYWWAHNCADAVADWLVELGCAVSWVPIRVDLVVE